MKELFIFSIILVSCSSNQIRKELEATFEKDTTDLEGLYWGPIDSVVNKKDTKIIYNSRMDTVISFTGIFSYLAYDHPFYSSIPKIVYNNVRKAKSHDENGDSIKAIKFNNLVYEYYRNGWDSSTIGFSCGNAYFAHKVNTSILISYSLEKLGLIDDAIDCVSPYLANFETNGTKIHLRFIELCIKKYGIDTVKREIEKCASTLVLKEQSLPVADDWRLVIFGAEIGVGKHYRQDSMTQNQAFETLKKTDIFSPFN